MKRILAVLILLSLVCNLAVATGKDGGEDGLAEIRRNVQMLRWAVGLLAYQMISVLEAADDHEASSEFRDAIAAAIKACDEILEALRAP